MISLDLTRMKPVRGGAFCDGLYSLLPNFVGGRRDGQLAPAEFQPFRRFEMGQPMKNDQQPLPPRYYVLFTDGYLLRYVDSALLPADYKYTDDDPGE